MRASSGIAALAAVAASAIAVPAAATQPATLNVFQFGAGFRYGFELEAGDFNPWGLGLGIDAGYTLPPAVYVGGVFDYFSERTASTSGN
jgi:hypothetical protein